MKLIILVISSKIGVYPEMESTIRNTWASKKDNDIKVLFQHCNGKNNETVIDSENNLLCKCNEKLENIGYKMLESLNFINKNLEYDYIFRTNLSSYVDTKKLYDYIKMNHIDYGGVIGLYSDNTKFASGAGYVLSKKSVNYILENQTKWDHSFIDDVALAKLMESDFNITPLKRQTINSVNEEIDLNHFHYRCKQKNRFEDLHILKKIYSLKND